MEKNHIPNNLIWSAKNRICLSYDFKHHQRLSRQHLLALGIFLKSCEMKSWPPKRQTTVACSHSNSAQFLSVCVTTLQFCFMSCPWLNLKTMTVSKSRLFLTNPDQPRSPRIRPNIKIYTLKDNEAWPWEDATNFHGYCGYKWKKKHSRKAVMSPGWGRCWIPNHSSPLQLLQGHSSVLWSL